MCIRDRYMGISFGSLEINMIHPYDPARIIIFKNAKFHILFHPYHLTLTVEDSSMIRTDYPSLRQPGFILFRSPEMYKCFSYISKKWKNHPLAVSYTHLRAHETSLHLVCRLLLEKKKNNNCTITTYNSY
eukprot:TRINITY_DN15092_c0_g1_i3.p1 TRINITY_DN15092_c0_g1~~TRINITY_DN15092_c0_g1_i3.p1  ORF type:complete len:130 (+),score=16.84 TRINITY_DN15092_c0_g1_i3:166-555(+)